MLELETGFFEVNTNRAFCRGFCIGRLEGKLGICRGIIMAMKARGELPRKLGVEYNKEAVDKLKRVFEDGLEAKDGYWELIKYIDLYYRMPIEKIANKVWKESEYWHLED